MNFINASDVTSAKELKVKLSSAAPINAVAVIGDNEFLEKLWESSSCGIPKDNPELFVCFVDYPYAKQDVNAGLTNIRGMAVQELFRVWTAAGLNRRKAKSPFGCKSFNEFVDLHRYSSEVSYVIFLRG